MMPSFSGLVVQSISIQDYTAFVAKDPSPWGGGVLMPDPCQWWQWAGNVISFLIITKTTYLQTSYYSA
jgi:hypothetical protein